MIINWINPKIIIGNTATGAYYYDRPDIVANIWEQIMIGNHVLLAAPRRVGKSSIMKFMIANTYVFVSPFLQAFWKRNNPVYHG